MGLTDLFFLLSAVVTHLVVIPVVGALFLLLCFRLLRVPGLTFFQSWKTYLAAVCYGLVVVVCLNFFLPWRELGSAELLTLQVGVTCLTHLVVVSLLLRKFSRRALLAQGLVVLLTNLFTITLLLSAS